MFPKMRRSKQALSPEEMESILLGGTSGVLALQGEDGYPYTVAVHFVYLDGRIYFHGLNAGQKLENIARCPRVCFETDVLDGLLAEDLQTPCSADSAYRSVVITGDAALVGDMEKGRPLAALVEKYTPRWAHLEMPAARVRGTAVAAVTPRTMTGKKHA